MVFTAAVNMLLARMLAPSEMGGYYIAISMVALIAGIGRVGMGQAVIRLVSESVAVNKFGRARQAVFKSALLSLAGGIVLAFLYYFGLGDLLAKSIFHSSGISSIAGLMAFAIIILSVQRVISEAFQGFHDMRGASISGSALPPAVFIAGLLLLRAFPGHPELQKVFVTYVISAAVAVIISGVFLRPKILNLQGSGNLAYNELLSIGLPVCLINIAVFASSQADLWIVGSVLSGKDAAVYGSVQRLIIFMTLSYGFVAAIFQSTVAELYVKGENRILERIAQGLTFWGCVATGILAVLYVFWGTEILRIFFGKFYEAGYWPLFILSIGQFVSLLFGPNAMILTMTGHQTGLMALTVIIGILTVPFGIFFARISGIVGVSIITAASSVIFEFCAWFMVCRKLGIKTHANFRRAVIAA